MLKCALVFETPSISAHSQETTEKFALLHSEMSALFRYIVQRRNWSKWLLPRLLFYKQTAGFSTGTLCNLTKVCSGFHICKQFAGILPPVRQRPLPPTCPTILCSLTVRSP